MREGLDQLNAFPPGSAHGLFMKACGSARWAGEMTRRRPFNTMSALLAAADEVWWNLDERDWLEAFAHHPRIGESALSDPGLAPTSEMSGKEQAGMAVAAESVRRAFVGANAAYEARFGHVFLICATGKTAEEMLAQVRARMGNDPGTELRRCAEEQSRITHLRLSKLLGGAG